MSLTKNIFKVLGKEAKSLARSEIRSVVKKKTSSLLKGFFAKSPEELQEEANQLLGYPTLHYKINKNNELEFKSSSVFIQEWLTNSPDLKNRLIKDEESGQVYLDGKELDNSKKIELINSFIKLCKIQSPAVNGHFESALKLLPYSDYTALRFKDVFAGWNPNNKSIINDWLHNCFGEGISTDLTYANMLFKKWIVGTARRAMNPGSSLDGCLVLQGPAGAGKTRHFRELLPEPFSQRTGEIHCDIKNARQFVESILGKTVACFDELSVLQNDKVEDVFKQLLSSQFMDLRLAYRRDPQRYGLRQGFSATTNADKFIKDPALCRRLWVLELNESRKLDFDYLYANRHLLWQEAVYLANNNESCYLSSSEQKQVEDQNKKYLIT